MNIIITGATSFIGAAVTKLLLKDNNVYAVVRPNSPNREKLGSSPRLSVIEMNLSEIDKLQEKSLPKMDVFIHFGWEGVGSQGRSDPAIQEKNVKNSLNAVKIAKTLGCNRFIFSGSQAEYGMHYDIITEESDCSPVSEYGKAKLLFANTAKQLCDSLELDFIHLRIFSVYGPDDHPWSLVNACLKTWCDGGKMSFGECTQKWNYLYIDDMAAVFNELLSCKVESHYTVFNIAGDDTRVLREFIEDMYKMCGEKGGFEYGARAANAEGPASLMPNISKIKAATSWCPETAFESGIEKTMKALKLK